jgi:hypothetical protein
MKAMISTTTNEVVAIVQSAETVENGIYVNKGIVNQHGVKLDEIWVDTGSIAIHDVEQAPSDFVPGKYLYNNGFVINPNYKEYISPERQMEILKEQLEAEKQNRIDLEGQLAATNADMQGLMDYLAASGVL